MTGLLDDRLALITGAGSGIGEGIARGMAAAGARIIAVDRDGAAAERTAKALGGKAYACDVSDRKAVDALAAAVMREVGAISVLVNNAGIIRRGTVFDAKARDDWDATMAVNLDGPYLVTTAFLEPLKQTMGAVVAIGSVQSFVALPNSAA